MSTKKSERDWDEAQNFLEELTGGPLTLGRAIAAIREGEEMSQVAMAEQLGISRANLCDIEKGRKFVSPDRAARWAKVLGYHEGQFVRLSLQDRVRQAGLKYVVSLTPEKSRKKGQAA